MNVVEDDAVDPEPLPPRRLRRRLGLALGSAAPMATAGQVRTHGERLAARRLT